MSDRRQWVPLTGLAGTLAIAVYMVVQLDAQSATPAVTVTNAVMAEVKDAQGQVVLQGQFGVADDDDDDDDSDRKAVLAPTGIDNDAAGEAEIEVSKATGAVQEVELEARGLTSGAAFTFFIDGREVAKGTADARGRLDVEQNVAAATPTQAR